MEVQARAKPQARTNAVIGAVLVGLFAVILAAILTVTGGTSTTSLWPMSIWQAAPEVQKTLADVRAGEKELLTPVQLKAAEPVALAAIRAGERAPVTEAQVMAPVNKALIAIRAAEREGR